MKYLKGKHQQGKQKLLAFGNPRTDKPLRHSVEEVATISRLFKGSEIYTEDLASEARFKDLAPEYDLIHLACHSELNSSYPMLSGLLLAPGSGEDGKLNAYELFAMHLNADLVVLSGCETGLGQMTNGDELVGLARAFIYAGASANVSSLWKVDDESTCYLMKRFYEYLTDHSEAESLRLAQLDSLKKYKEQRLIQFSSEELKHI